MLSPTGGGQAGHTRGIGRDVKSSVHLIGGESAITTFNEKQEEIWITNRIRDTNQVLLRNNKIEVFGTSIGMPKERDEYSKNACANYRRYEKTLPILRTPASNYYSGDLVPIQLGGAPRARAWMPRQV